jgi:hypothetical protein
MAGEVPDAAGRERAAHARLPAVVGVLGTLAVCSSVLITHLSAEQLRPLSASVWILGVVIQISALAMALALRHFERH